MAGVKRKAKLLAAIERIEHHLRAEKVIGDLARMHFQGEANGGFLANIQNRLPLWAKDAKPSATSSGLFCG